MWWDNWKPIPYQELLTKKILEEKQQSRFTREQAISMAKDYHLEEDVIECMDTYGMSPDEALEEWDLYPY